MATYASLLEAAKTALAQILGGVAVEWWEGGHRVKVADPDVMLKVIQRLETLAAEEEGGSSMRPIIDL